MPILTLVRARTIAVMIMYINVEINTNYVIKLYINVDLYTSHRKADVLGG